MTVLGSPAYPDVFEPHCLATRGEELEEEEEVRRQMDGHGPGVEAPEVRGGARLTSEMLHKVREKPAKAQSYGQATGT